MTTFPLLNLTLAIFRSPELGFLGFVVPTFKHTPFISGLFASAGDLSFRSPCADLPPRSTCISVHLCAREAATGRMGSIDVAFWRAVAPIAGRAGTEESAGARHMTEGRTRRRKNWAGMICELLVMRDRDGASRRGKVQDPARRAWAVVCAHYPPHACCCCAALPCPRTNASSFTTVPT